MPSVEGASNQIRVIQHIVQLDAVWTGLKTTESLNPTFCSSLCIVCIFCHLEINVSILFGILIELWITIVYKLQGLLSQELSGKCVNLRPAEGQV